MSIDWSEQTWRVDAFEISQLRDAQAYRDANPPTTPEEEAEYAYLDAWHDRAEELHVTMGRPAAEKPDVDPERPVRPANPNGASSSRPSANGPSEKQLGFIVKLCGERGIDPATVNPRDKRHASGLIDALLGWKQGPMPAILTKHGAKPLHPVEVRQAASARRERMASEKQVEFVTDLLSNRDTQGVDVPEDPTQLTAEKASYWIEKLLPFPQLRRTQAAHGIRTGRYAYLPEGTEQAQFYIVDTRGKIWVQAGPARHPYNGKLNAALEAIKVDPKTAAALYGQLLGRCGRCGLELTDKDSKERGLGPVCAGKSEW